MSIKQTTTNRTNTSLFLLPGVGLDISMLKPFGFINAYIGDIKADHYSYCIYLLFKPTNIEKFNDFLNEQYISTGLIVDEYDYDGGFVVVVYKFPEDYQQEYKLFLSGKYSQFRKKYKDLFPIEIDSEDDAGPFTQPSFFFHVFNRTKELEKYWFDKIGEKLDKDGEYWSRPDVVKETLNIEKINI